MQLIEAVHWQSIGHVLLQAVRAHLLCRSRHHYLLLDNEVQDKWHQRGVPNNHHDSGLLRGHLLYRHTRRRRGSPSNRVPCRTAAGRR